MIATIRTDDSSDQADIHDLTSQESILDLARGPISLFGNCGGTIGPSMKRLIGFSNHEFYYDTLIVFPSPKGMTQSTEFALFAVDGIYEAGLNRVEAEAITEAAQTSCSGFPHVLSGLWP